MRDEVKKMAKVFKALGEPTRLRIIKILASEGGYFCVGALAKKLGISQPAVSQHLKVLKEAGILDSKRMGYHVHYYVDAETFKIYKEKINELMEKAFEKRSCPKNGECINLTKEKKM
jgi:ArsR family transcriptional regulator